MLRVPWAAQQVCGFIVSALRDTSPNLNKAGKINVNKSCFLNRLR